MNRNAGNPLEDLLMTRITVLENLLVEAAKELSEHKTFFATKYYAAARQVSLKESRDYIMEYRETYYPKKEDPPAPKSPSLEDEIGQLARRVSILEGLAFPGPENF
jgi:hypothetical protein